MKRLLLIASLALLTQTGICQGKAKPKPLSDAALDRVTAAGVTAGLSNGVVNFQGSTMTPNGLVTGAGTLAVLTGPLSGSGTTNIGSINLSGTAQQNLSSLVNINAVNSNINVLLNLNVTMNSTIGTVTQSNASGRH